jgi:hypothetical protein
VGGYDYLLARHTVSNLNASWNIVLHRLLTTLDRSTGAGVLRTIFLCISYPMGRMDWDYKQPADQKTPLVLQVFNPTFWVMIEITLGLWAANLPPMAPLLQAMGLMNMVNTVYRKASAVYDTISRGEKTSTQTSSQHQHPIPIIQKQDSEARPIFDPYFELDTRAETRVSRGPSRSMSPERSPDSRV